MADATPGQIDALLQEQRRFPPPAEFAAHANLNDPGDLRPAPRDPEGFWAEQAQAIDWFKPWDKVLEWNAPWAKWFVGGELNASYNCVDRHLKTWRRNKAAIIFEGEPGDSRVLTYRDLYREVNRAAAALQTPGRQEGRPGGDLPGHDPRAADRDAGLRPPRRAAHRHLRRLQRRTASPTAINDCGRKVRHHRRRRLAARQQDPAQRNDGQGRWTSARPSRRCWSSTAPTTPTQVADEGGPRRLVARCRWTSRAARSSSPSTLDAEHPLYILYTSGTTGKPKGMLHTTGGYLVGTACDPQVRLRPEGRGRLLLHRRHRLGDRPLLHRLRPAGQRRDVRHVRGLAGLSRQGPLLVDRREVRRHDPVHRADGDPHVHALGQGVSRASTI